MKVKKHTLLLLACVVWSIAGWNVLRIGLSCYPPYLSILNLLISAAVFALFEKMVFGRLVTKHTRRIRAYEQEHLFLPHHGIHDDRWNPDSKPFPASGVGDCRILHRSGVGSPAGRGTVWKKLSSAFSKRTNLTNPERKSCYAGNYGNSI